MPSLQKPLQIEVLPNFSVDNEKSVLFAKLFIMADEGIQAATQDRVEDRLAKMDGETLFVAKDDDDQVMAMAGLKRMVDVPEGIVLNVATMPRYRRNGVGTAVMQKLIEVAGEEGLEYIHVHPGPGSGPFYANLGFDHKLGKSFNPSWGSLALVQHSDT